MGGELLSTIPFEAHNFLIENSRCLDIILNTLRVMHPASVPTRRSQLNHSINDLDSIRVYSEYDYPSIHEPSLRVTPHLQPTLLDDAIPNTNRKQFPRKQTLWKSSLDTMSDSAHESSTNKPPLHLPVSIYDSLPESVVVSPKEEAPDASSHPPASHHINRRKPRKRSPQASQTITSEPETRPDILLEVIEEELIAIAGFDKSHRSSSDTMKELKASRETRNIVQRKQKEREKAASLHMDTLSKQQLMALKHHAPLQIKRRRKLRRDIVRKIKTQKIFERHRSREEAGFSSEDENSKTIRLDEARGLPQDLRTLHINRDPEERPRKRRRYN